MGCTVVFADIKAELKHPLPRLLPKLPLSVSQSISQPMASSFVSSIEHQSYSAAKTKQQQQQKEKDDRKNLLLFNDSLLYMTSLSVIWDPDSKQNDNKKNDWKKVEDRQNVRWRKKKHEEFLQLQKQKEEKKNDQFHKKTFKQQCFYLRDQFKKFYEENGKTNLTRFYFEKDEKDEDFIINFPDYSYFYVRIEPRKVEWNFKDIVVTHEITDDNAYKIFVAALLAPTMWNEREYKLRIKYYKKPGQLDCGEDDFGHWYIPFIENHTYQFGSHPLFCIESRNWLMDQDYYLNKWTDCIYCGENHARGCCSNMVSCKTIYEINGDDEVLKDWCVWEVIERNLIDFCHLSWPDLASKKKSVCSSCEEPWFEHEEENKKYNYSQPASYGACKKKWFDLAYEKQSKCLSCQKLWFEHRQDKKKSVTKEDMMKEAWSYWGY